MCLSSYLKSFATFLNLSQLDIHKQLGKMLSRFWSKPVIPLLMINSSLNQQKAAYFLNQLQKINYKRARAVAMVIDINNHMPVQIDKIAQFIQDVRKKYSIKVLGFCHNNVTLESYYLLSKANQIYTYPSTLFQLSRGVQHFSIEGFWEKVGVQKMTAKSDPNVIGRAMDQYTTVNSSQYINKKMTEISSRIYQESILHRKQIKGKELSLQAPDTLLGSEAIVQGYADKVGSYYDVLRKEYPDCDIKHIRLRDKWSTRTLELMVASPIIIILFLIKVLIKYSIIMYLWLKHKKNKKEKQGSDI